VTSAIRDAAGALWFGTISGLSRLDVSDDRSSGAVVAPAVFIGSLTVAGVPQAVSEVGEVEPASVTMSPGQNQIEIGFFGFSFETGSPLRYTYRLEGAQTDWSAPTDLRSVNYARLSPGSYTFQVRAVRADGAISVEPASVALRVMPPFYLRWWFIGIVAATAAGAVLALYRVRVAQLLRVERVRARIATDLHDDIGASLSQIAILAEVARERMKHPPPGPASAEPAAAEPLARIAETSRGLVDSMSDIVWAINPEADSLSDLVHRMRRFAEDTLGAGDIEVVFRAPDSSEDLPVGADVRREIFLILKESVTNIAKHANATRVSIDVESNGRRVWLRVADNGRGFDPGVATDGNGVASMRRRVAALGGHLAIESAPGRGTTITLDVERRKQ
jgi:signal transduction histidine kinase